MTRERPEGPIKRSCGPDAAGEKEDRGICLPPGLNGVRAEEGTQKEAKSGKTKKELRHMQKEANSFAFSGHTMKGEWRE